MRLTPRSAGVTATGSTSGFAAPTAAVLGACALITRPSTAGQCAFTATLTPRRWNPFLADAGRQLVASAQSNGLAWSATAVPAADAGRVGIPHRADGRKERSFHLIDGAVYQVRDGALVTAGKTGKELRELTALVLLRDSAVSLLDAEADHDRSEESLAPLRARLNVTYDRYVAAYGPLNRVTITHGEPDPETGLATLSRRAGEWVASGRTRTT